MHTPATLHRSPCSRHRCAAVHGIEAVVHPVAGAPHATDTNNTTCCAV